jgi:hypothetical protein
MKDLRSTVGKLLGCFLLFMAMATATVSTPTVANHPSDNVARISVAYAPPWDGGMPPPDLD